MTPAYNYPIQASVHDSIVIEMGMTTLERDALLALLREAHLLGDKSTFDAPQPETQPFVPVTAVVDISASLDIDPYARRIRLPQT